MKKPDFTEAAEKYVKHVTTGAESEPDNTFNWEDIKKCASIDFKAGAEHGYNEAMNERELNNKAMKTIDESRVAKALEVLLTGLAKDGVAIEGFTEGWAALHEYHDERFKKKALEEMRSLSFSKCNNCESDVEESKWVSLGRMCPHCFVEQ